VVVKSPDASYLISIAILFLVLTAVGGVALFRRGERWSIAALLMIPPGVLLGIYATDAHHRWLDVPAVILILSPPILRRVIMRRDPRRAAGK
jgi:hypothetical protein